MDTIMKNLWLKLSVMLWVGVITYSAYLDPKDTGMLMLSMLLVASGVYICVRMVKYFIIKDIDREFGKDLCQKNRDVDD